MAEQKPIRITSEEMRWLDENRARLEKQYPGRFIAVYGRELVGLGSSMKEAADQARAKGIERPLLTGLKSLDYQDVYVIRSPHVV
jgi:hypothetical protein